MRGISLQQPWATLVASRAKRIETRSWRTSYRGPLLIHASAEMPREAEILCNHPGFADKLRQAGYEPTERYGRPVWPLPLGVALAVVELEDCVPTESIEIVSVYEGLFGDFTPGRWAWKLGSVRRLPRPIRCRGALGLWEPSEEVRVSAAASLPLDGAERGAQNRGLQVKIVEIPDPTGDRWRTALRILVDAGRRARTA